jgi:Putative peptidoglycan binding domain
VSGMPYMMKCRLLIALLSLSLPGFAQSPLPLSTDQEGRAKEMEQQWKELRAKDSAAWDKFKASLVLDAQEAFAEFGYGTVFTATLDDRTKEALRKYQGRSGLAVTGDLDARTWIRLQDDKSALHTDIPLGVYMFLDSDWNSWVRVRGDWLQQGKEPDANTPEKPALVECLKSAGMCVMVTANSSDYLNLAYFEIERWDAYEITTRPLDLPCARETIRISKPDQTVLDVNTAAYENSDACTKLFGKQGEQMVSRLGDPAKIRHAKLTALRAARDRIELISPEAKHRAGLEDH